MQQALVSFPFTFVSLFDFHDDGNIEKIQIIFRKADFLFSSFDKFSYAF